jgi:CRP-like cAMP-binding protein
MTGFSADNLGAIPFFQNFSSDAIKAIVMQSHQISASKGQVIIMNDQPADRFYIAQTGWIKLYRETIDGAQSMIDILTSHQVFGETAIFQNDIYPYTAEAAEDSKVISLPLSILKSEIETNSKLAMDMMASMARYRKQQDQEIENRTLKNAPQRIGCFLLRLIDQSKKGEITIQLPYDKTLVASRLGMQPETFSRALNKLKDEIDMDVKGRDIYIHDIQDLIDYACSACSSEFPCHDIL